MVFTYSSFIHQQTRSRVMTRKFCKIAANVMALFTLVRFWNIIWETDNYTILSWPDFIILMGCFLSVGTIIICIAEEYPRFKLFAYSYNLSFFTLAIGLLCFRINLFTISKICLLITSFLFTYTFFTFFITSLKIALEVIKKTLFNSNHM